jgi:hypothetical protein
MKCEDCTIKKAEPVPYIVHEGIMARMERTIKRLWVVLIIVILLLAASNGAWIWYESQFEAVTTEITQENENGYNSFIGNDGDIYNGTTENQDNPPSP